MSETQTEIAEKLKKLREPFPENQIGWLPRPMLKKEDMDKIPKHNCPICGQYHAKDKVLHLSYVGHAALTDRLLDVDPMWHWEPVAFDSNGLPAVDKDGGMWIKLTILGVTKLGYGDAQAGGQKTGANATKERIGDALRNAAMRFGCALEMWHKGDLNAHKIATENPITEADLPDEPEDPYILLCQRLEEEIAAIKIGINKGDYTMAADAWLSLPEEDKMAIWKAPKNGGCLTTEERAIMKTSEFRAAATKIESQNQE